MSEESMGARRSKHGELPPHVQLKVRGTKRYYYYRRQLGGGAEKLFPLRGEPYNEGALPNPDWWAAYNAYNALPMSSQRIDCDRSGSFNELIIRFKANHAFNMLSPRTRTLWERNLDRIGLDWGPKQVAGVRKKDVFELRDRYSGTPASTNNMLRTLSSMLSWAASREWLAANPCLNLKGLMFKPRRRYEPWDWSHIRLLEKSGEAQMWWIAAVALYTGQRLGDCLKLKWADEQDGFIAVKQSKTRKQLWVPMHRDLTPIWNQLPRNSDFVLTNKAGRPWSDNGFQATWNRQMMKPVLSPIRQAGLVFHGLRKSAVVMLLEAGCTDAEVASITGQSREMVDYYAQRVNQRRLASSAILKWQDKSAGKLADSAPES